MLTLHKTEFFPAMPPDSKVWIYQADRVMNEEEVAFAGNALRDFINSWESHGHLLKSDFNISDKLFIILAVDEDTKDASGCSIDKSVNIVKIIGQKLNIDFFNRMKIAYMSDEIVKLVRISDIKDLINAGDIKPDTVFFDNLVTNKSDLNQKWLKEVNNSWLSKYF